MSERDASVDMPTNWGAHIRECVRHFADEAGRPSPWADRTEAIVSALVRVMGEYDLSLPGHGERTATYALGLAQELGLPDADLHDLRRAALLHDLGRLLLPEGLLQTCRPLTGEEYALVQSHPRGGAELLDPFPALRQAALWIAHHHERWDGWGYPYGLRAGFIPLGARILAVADTFDALLARAWPGQPATMNPRSALRVLQACAGTQLDPGLVRHFVALCWDEMQTDPHLVRHPGW